MAEIKAPLNQIWAIYNHLPGGHMVAIHFEDIHRKQHQGNQIKTVLITAKEQVDSFKKADQVALNVNGKIVKNEVIIYQGPTLEGDPKAADKVIAYALAKGMLPILGAAQKAAIAATDGRVAQLEGEVAGLRRELTQVLELLKQPAIPTGAKS